MNHRKGRRFVVDRRTEHTNEPALSGLKRRVGDRPVVNHFSRRVWNLDDVEDIALERTQRRFDGLCYVGPYLRRDDRVWIMLDRATDDALGVAICGGCINERDAVVERLANERDGV